MSQARQMINNYNTIRARLRNPPNAKTDWGIDLKNRRIPSQDPPKKKALEYLNPVHCRVNITIMPKPPIEPIMERMLTFNAIERGVCHNCNVSLTDLRGPLRYAKFKHARNICWYLLRKHTTLSYPQIGRRHSGRDHSTIIHGHRKLVELLLVDEVLAEFVKLIEFELFAGYHDRDEDFPRPPKAPISEPDLAQGEGWPNIQKPQIYQMDNRSGMVSKAGPSPTDQGIILSYDHREQARPPQKRCG